MSVQAKTVTAHARSGGDRFVMVFVGDRSFRHDLDGVESCVIGRGEEADLRIDDASVSRRHARLDLGGGGAMLEDLGSHNGTRINGARLTAPAAVNAGDVITIGDAVLVCYLPRRMHWQAVLERELLVRLDAEIDRVDRYERRVALVLWSLPHTVEGVAPLLAPVLRRCDAIGLLPDGTLGGVFPELAIDDIVAVAERGLDLLRVAAPGVRAGVAAYPGDGIDASSLMAAARDALAVADDSVSRADRAIRRFELGGRAVYVADPCMVRVYDLVRRLARGELPVLISGETGTGKELAARAVHEWSARAAGPYVPVNCAALPDSLVESELFGHRRGAFTGADRDKIGLFEHARGGTLFLDELGELSLAAQAKLLRAVDTRTITPVGHTAEVAVDVRLVAATNRDLEAEVAAGRFRRDLYYRLNAAVVALPPLRARPRDVAVLARAFLDDACRRTGRTPMRISDPALRRLAALPFPGNVRELANAMEYAATVTPDDVLEVWHLPGAATVEHDASGPEFRPIADELAELERRRMREALETASGNQSRAAEIIGMPRRTFVTKMTKYGLR